MFSHMNFMMPKPMGQEAKQYRAAHNRFANKCSKSAIAICRLECRFPRWCLSIALLLNISVFK